jgi:hypothetical protein
MSNNDVKVGHRIISEQEAILNDATERVENLEKQVEKIVKKKKTPTRWSYVKQEHQIKKGKSWVKDASKEERPWNSAGDFVADWCKEVADQEEDGSGSMMSLAMKYRMKVKEIRRYRNALNKAFKEAGHQVGDDLVLKDLQELNQSQEQLFRSEKTSPTQTDLHELLKIAKYRT